MKFLIWFLCILVNALIITGLRYSGVLLGAIPTVLLFVGMMALARFLCKKWDEHQYYRATYAAPPTTRSDEPADENHWKCSCGRIHPLYETSCVCGVSKANAKANPVGAGNWQCSCGKIHPKYVSSCVCGKTKADAVKNP